MQVFLVRVRPWRFEVDFEERQDSPPSQDANHKPHGAEGKVEQSEEQQALNQRNDTEADPDQAKRKVGAKLPDGQPRDVHDQQSLPPGLNVEKARWGEGVEDHAACRDSNREQAMHVCAGRSMSNLHCTRS